MKLQYLAVIFLLIILPIVMVLSQYIDYNIDAINLRHEYNTKLINSTYDALKSYQINTVNNAISDIPASKVDELEAAVNTFLKSISTNFGFTGYNPQTMREYIPAVVFTLYDGYYIYSPFENILTGVNKNEVDKSFLNEDDTDGKKLYGLKPYIYYSCRYKNGNNYDVVINYTLDNYITIKGLIGGDYYEKSGYLIDGIKQLNDYTWVDINENNAIEENEKMYDYEFDGVTFKYDEKQECLIENLGDGRYPYAKLNGTKYYLKDNGGGKGEVFYINDSGEKDIQTSSDKNLDEFIEYRDFITKNNSSYRYYKESYDFTTWVRTMLKDLKTSEAKDVDTGAPISNFGDDILFGEDNDKETTGDNSNYIQDNNSIFNMHRSEVIRYIVTKNLSVSIASYKNYYDSTEEFIMPKISEQDWETIENNVSIITFLQGFKIVGRDYNEYCVVANNLNKEYVDENDIYILGKDHIYYRVNDTTLDDSKLDNGKWLFNNTVGEKYAPRSMETKL